MKNNGQWDLTILYENFDDPAIEADMAEAKTLVARMGEIAGKLPYPDSRELIRDYLETLERLQVLGSKLGEFASLNYSVDTSNVRAQALIGRLRAAMSEIAAPDAAIRKAIAETEGLEELIREVPEFSRYAYFLGNIKRDGKYLLSAPEERVFSLMNISGANAWSDLHDTITSTVNVNYRGDNITLSAVRNLAYDPDPQVRKDAYDAELACYPAIEQPGAFALNSIKLQVLSECRLRGFASPLAQALYRSRMSEKTLDALLGAMNDYLPAFHRYLRAKGRALGHENGLPWWDMFAPMGSLDKKYTVDEARNYLLEIFGGFDSDLHDMVKTAFDEAWIDFFPRKGKVGGAFDAMVPSAGQSRVLTNFDGAFGDIVTLAHELGHAFHDRQMIGLPMLQMEYTMPVAESASTFNEVLVVSTAIERAASKEEKLALIENQLSDACQIICDIYSRFLFEKSVFDNRDNEFMGPERLCRLMHEAQVKAYGDGIAEDTLHSYMWLCKGHYYSGGLSYYNFPYAFGGLFSRGLYALYKKQGSAFVPLYKKLLRGTGENDVEDTARLAGIDLTDKAFWAAGLQSLSDEIDEFCSLL